MRRIAHALLLSLLLASCSKSSEPVPKRLEKYVLEKPPANVGKKLDIGFDGRVTLLGARVDAAAELEPGDRVRLKLFWRSDARVDDDVRLSTHLLDGAGKRISDLDYAGPLRKRVQKEQVLGPGRWTPGKIYVDEQSFRVPKGWKTQKLEVAVSLADGEHRLPIVQGKGDAQNRATVASLVVRPQDPKPRAKRPGPALPPAVSGSIAPPLAPPPAASSGATKAAASVPSPAPKPTAAKPSTTAPLKQPSPTTPQPTN
jgi:hypothetical protein